jgi:hypothetical protein
MALTSGSSAAPPGPRGLALMLGWRRVAFTLTLSTLIGLALSSHWEEGPLVGLIRVIPLGLMTMLTFGLFEQWPKRLPRWLARWVLQVLGVALIIPIVTTAIYVLSTSRGAPVRWCGGTGHGVRRGEPRRGPRLIDSACS